MPWRIATGTLSLERPTYLGILNLTPDSFSDGGQYVELESALDQADRLRKRGAGLLDLGAESTRPGATPISPEEEWRRLGPVLERLRREAPNLPLSLDTRHVEIARRGLALGVEVLNDVTGFSDPELLELVRTHSCGLIAMRSRIQNGALVMPDYGSSGETTAARAIRELASMRDRILATGLSPERLLLDPGFGFGTTHGEDAAIWEALPRLPAALGWPPERFCIGISRKRFLAWRNGTPSLPPAQRDALTAEAHHEAAAWGYRVFRTHALPMH